MAEEWKDITGYEGMYQISNLGNVRSLVRDRCNGGVLKEKILRNRPSKSRTGAVYYQVALFKNGKRKNFSVHRLVANEFIPNTENKPFINHIDGNPSNNHVSNLEWCTPKENTIHAWEMGLCKNSLHFGKDNKMSIPVDVYTREGVFVGSYESISLASSVLGLNQGNARSVLIGKRKHTKGYVLKPKGEI